MANRSVWIQGSKDDLLVPEKEHNELEELEMEEPQKNQKTGPNLGELSSVVFVVFVVVAKIYIFYRKFLCFNQTVSLSGACI